ncbi:hypothetical protein HR080_04640 [Staphylococcus schleiferi subsp. coagulans]|uniref:hypothetical protein n=1 Tax=Staphylococcus coagulans TaxID=74706 RepID=UPI0015F8E1A1|nr:hypothetical protein [Staphylococcus coagulans]MBA8778644.1 hypothetical protein [Staphylococcus coagulans]
MMWLIITAIALLITVVIAQHIVIITLKDITLKDKRYIPSGGLVDKPNFNYIKTERGFRLKSLAKTKKERGGKIPPGKGLYNEAIKIDPKEYLEKYKKRRVNEMINKATEKPKEVEYIEFKGYENFKEVADFVGYHFSKFVLKVNRYGEEVVGTDNGTFETGVIFYRYLDADTEEYKYDVMSKDKFFRVYTEEVSE